MKKTTSLRNRILPLLLAVLALAGLLCGCGRSASPSIAEDAAGSGYAGPAPAFSEIVPRNTSCFAAKDGGYYPWVELVNDKDEPVQLREHYLTNDQSQPTLWQFPSIVLEPGQRMVLFLSGLPGMEGELHASFALQESDAALYLYTLDGKLADSIAWVTPAIGNLAAVKSGVLTRYTAFPTPWEENDPRILPEEGSVVMGEQDPLQLNELMRENTNSITDMYGERHSWVELHNCSAQPVSLLGYGLSDRIGDPAKWLFPDVTLPPDGYLIVFLSGKDSHGSELHTSFTLDADCETVLLTDLATNRVDFIPIVQKAAPAFVIGRTEDGSFRVFAAASPGQPNTGLQFEAYREPFLQEQ